MQIPEIDKLIQSVIENIPGKAGPFGEELQNYLQQALSSALKKMDLVTRHEFDIQSAVLQRTREKVEKMEEMIKQMESRLLNK
ncbi:MAG: accessory factor UbiK family protein [Gammaproteobacteria bacterium]|nr:accessory factor UbiK family protein [Gammaproteobacteria bacterium]MCW8988741.1 accessory factor UbiK family protein [Gammaproteobacteria bacterium]